MHDCCVVHTAVGSSQAYAQCGSASRAHQQAVPCSKRLLRMVLAAVTEGSAKAIISCISKLNAYALSQVLMRIAVKATSSQPSQQGSACRSGHGMRGRPGRWSGARTLAAGGAELRSLHPLLVCSLTVTLPEI